MRFFLLASVLSLFAAPVLADAQPPLVGNHKPAARVVNNEAIPRAAPNTKNVSTRTTATKSDAHQFQTRQLLNLGFGSIINVCVQVTGAVSQSVVTVSGQNLALGVGDCICIETSTGLAATGTQPLTGLITGLTAPATVRVYVNGQQLTAASAVPIANTVLASTCTTLLGANLLTFLAQTILGLGGSCSGAFQSNAALRAAIGANICQTNQQTLSAGIPILGTAVNLQNSVPIFNAGATDFNTRCCARACSAGFFACGNTCVATGTNCVSGAVVPVVRKRRDQAGAILCPKGLTGCLVPGSRVYDCVDVKNDLESCGGCVDPANPLKPGSGTDCTSLVGVNDVECVRGTCQIRSCNKGYALAANGTSCESLDGAPALKINSSARQAVIKRKAARTFSRM